MWNLATRRWVVGTGGLARFLATPWTGTTPRTVGSVGCKKLKSFEGNDKSCERLRLWFLTVINVRGQHVCFWMWGVSDVTPEALVSCRMPPIHGPEKTNHGQFQKLGKWHQHPRHMQKLRNQRQCTFSNQGMQGNAVVGFLSAKRRPCWWLWRATDPFHIADRFHMAVCVHLKKTQFNRHSGVLWWKIHYS